MLSAKKSAVFTGVLYSGFYFPLSNFTRETLLPVGVLASQLARIPGKKALPSDKGWERKGRMLFLVLCFHIIWPDPLTGKLVSSSPVLFPSKFYLSYCLNPVVCKLLGYE